jgi:N-acyl homoserine lactone hydrolase
VAVALG